MEIKKDHQQWQLENVTTDFNGDTDLIDVI